MVQYMIPFVILMSHDTAWLWGGLPSGVRLKKKQALSLLSHPEAALTTDIQHFSHHSFYQYFPANNHVIVEINLFESSHFLLFMIVLEVWLLYNHTKNKSN